MQWTMRPWVATCDETRKRLSDHLEGELPEREEKRVLRHLVRCKHCRALLRSLAHAIHALHELGRVEVAPAHSSVADVVVERIRRESG
jgi:predicted anti-sigma-YlaC factor YlaD